MTELIFTRMAPRIEVRDSQWVDIEIRLETSEETPVPSDLIDMTALVITNTAGRIAQIVPLDEGMDCDYQFTASEKAQLAAFVEDGDIQQCIASLVLQHHSNLC